MEYNISKNNKENLSKMINELAVYKLKNNKQCDRWLEFYHWYLEELKKYVIVKNRSVDLTKYSEQSKWTYLKFCSFADKDNISFFSGATTLDNFEKDLPTIGKFISVKDREIAMYLFANSLDCFLKQNIYNTPADQRMILDHNSSTSPCKREIIMHAGKAYLGEVFISQEFMEPYGHVVDGVLNCYKRGEPTDEVLTLLRNGILSRKTTGNFDKILRETKEAAVKVLKI